MTTTSMRRVLSRLVVRASMCDTPGAEVDMGLTWTRENPSRWDDDKQAIIGGAPEGSVQVDAADGELLPGAWWRVEDDGKTVGYGWMDVTWGYAPVLLAVDADAQGKGVGAFILDKLAAEAKAQGLAYIFNKIPTSHPEPERLGAWLQAHGFEAAASDSRMLRRHVV
jgi:GNAT superfamily N-acetyltransferase